MELRFTVSYKHTILEGSSANPGSLHWYPGVGPAIKYANGSVFPHRHEASTYELPSIIDEMSFLEEVEQVENTRLLIGLISGINPATKEKVIELKEFSVSEC